MDHVPTHSKLGKLRGGSLPVEYDLERYIQHLEKIDSTWNTVTPACQWRGVTCDSESDEVMSIDWGDRDMSGVPMWEYLPSSITLIRLAFNRLTGTIPFAQLPRNMTDLNVTANLFHGPLEFAHLPGQMRTLSLSRNQFSGFVTTSDLRTLVSFYASDNPNLRGEIQFSDLRENFSYICTGTQIVIK